MLVAVAVDQNITGIKHSYKNIHIRLEEIMVFVISITKYFTTQLIYIR